MANPTENEKPSGSPRPSIVARLRALDAAGIVGGAASALKRALRTQPVTTLASAVGLFFVLRLAWIQLSTLNYAIFVAEGHHWRQSFTFGVAWNYAHTTIDVLRPRMFLELDKSNIIAMEPPLYPIVVSGLLRLSGDSDLGPRLVSWLSLVAIVVVLWKMLRRGSRDARDVWADRAGLLIAVSVSTMMATDFRSIQPEPMAAGLSMIAALYFVRYRDSEHIRDIVIGATLTTLAILTKPVVLGIVPGLALFAVWGPGRWLRRGIIVSAAIAPGLLLYVAWDRWATHLLRTELNGYALIAIDHDAKTMFRNLTNAGFGREALFHFLPNYAGSWWLAPALVAGMFRGIAEPRLRRFSVPFLIWIAGYLVELLAFGDRLHSNAYYFILAPAPVAYFSALGVGAMVRVFDSSDQRPALRTSRVGLAVALLLPVGLAVAKHVNWASADAADLGLERHRDVWTSDIGLLRMFGVLLVAIALGPLVRPRRIPKYLGVPLLIAVLATGQSARREVVQYLRYFTAMDKREGFREELTALRVAVAKYTTVDERLAINGDEMFVFYYALRNGFSVEENKPVASRPDVAARARKARVYVHIEPTPGETTAPRLSGRILEQGTWWRVYCVDNHDCAPDQLRR